MSNVEKQALGDALPEQAVCFAATVRAACRTLCRVSEEKVAAMSVTMEGLTAGDEELWARALVQRLAEQYGLQADVRFQDASLTARLSRGREARAGRAQGSECAR